MGKEQWSIKLTEPGHTEFSARGHQSLQWGHQSAQRVCIQHLASRPVSPGEVDVIVHRRSKLHDSRESSLSITVTPSLSTAVTVCPGAHAFLLRKDPSLYRHKTTLGAHGIEKKARVHKT
jgi:hypothetical protein